MTICIVLGFQHSVNIAYAYGITVSAVSMITTWMFCVVCVYYYKMSGWKLIFPILFFLAFSPIDMTYFFGQLLKIPSGGWFSICLSCLYITIMYCWVKGEEHLNIEIKKKEESAEMKEFICNLSMNKEPILMQENSLIDLYIKAPKSKNVDQVSQKKSPRLGVFYIYPTQTKEDETENNMESPVLLPLTTLYLVDQICSLPDYIFFLEVNKSNMPYEKEIVSLRKYNENMFHLVVSVGYTESAVETQQIVLNALKMIDVIKQFHSSNIHFFVPRNIVQIETKNPFHSIVYSIYEFLRRVFPKKPTNLVIPDTIVEISSIQKLT